MMDRWNISGFRTGPRALSLCTERVRCVARAYRKTNVIAAAATDDEETRVDRRRFGAIAAGGPAGLKDN